MKESKNMLYRGHIDLAMKLVLHCEQSQRLSTS
jgi:hypothetical protein